MEMRAPKCQLTVIVAAFFIIYVHFESTAEPPTNIISQAKNLGTTTLALTTGAHVQIATLFANNDNIAARFNIIENAINAFASRFESNISLALTSGSDVQIYAIAADNDNIAMRFNLIENTINYIASKFAINISLTLTVGSNVQIYAVAADNDNIAARFNLMENAINTITTLIEVPNLKGDCWQGAQCANCDRDDVSIWNGLRLCCQNCVKKGQNINMATNTCYCNHGVTTTASTTTTPTATTKTTSTTTTTEASNTSGCTDSYPIDDTESCPKCHQLENEGKCDMKWKKALRGKENKRCRQRFNSNQLKDKVDQWCKISCGSCTNGEWGCWGPYSECSATCGNGTKTRARQCNNPPPSGGGSSCIGEVEEIKTCHAGYCPIPGCNLLDGNLMSQDEELIGIATSPNECVMKIREMRPSADGMTWDPDSMNCYAEIEASNSTDGPCKTCKTCIFDYWRSNRILACQALEGADNYDLATGQCRCGNNPACSPTSTMPVCYNPSKPTAFCGCRFPLNNEPSSCKEPNPFCDSLTATCQCQSFVSPVRGVCPAEYSNKCNIAALGGRFPDDLCACVQDPSQTIDTNNPPTTFCAADSKICKADVNGDIDCRYCSDGECPNFAPRCDGTKCLCGTSLPFGTSGTLDMALANTCSGKHRSDKFVCGATGDPCVNTSVNPFCLDDLFSETLGSASSTCKCIDNNDCTATTNVVGNVVNGVCKVVATDMAKTNLGKCVECTPQQTPPIQGDCETGKTCQTNGICL